jgi:membrane-bound metal-dependent hydrolase YbcI (DUF457 family)
MPSPVGHLLAGIAVAWVADLVPGRRAWRAAATSASWYRRAGNGLTLACAAMAAAPDLDLLARQHRTVTHSLGAVILVGLLAGAIAARLSRPVVRVALMCAAAYGSHILLDWVGVDRSPPHGIQALWPFSDAWYLSNLDGFAPIERRSFLSVSVVWRNAAAVAREILILGPLVWGLWLVRVKALAGLTAQLSRGDHPPQ